MYSPDGFASLACALHQQCWFLTYQDPFIYLIQLFNTPITFFLLQALLWFTLIGVIYFLSKELHLKHLFITPIILLFTTSFFVDNFIGSFENDCFGIILIILSTIFHYKYKNTKKKINILYAYISLQTSILYWLWPGYLIRIPVFVSTIVEVPFWTHWLGYMLLFPIILSCIISGIKYRDKIKIGSMLFILFFPKLFIFGTPILLKFIDEILDKILKKENTKYIITIIVFALILGQGLRVGINTYNSWTRTIENESCVTVNDEYFLRATKGLNYSYNQISTQEVNLCKQQTSG